MHVSEGVSLETRVISAEADDMPKHKHQTGHEGARIDSDGVHVLLVAEIRPETGAKRCCLPAFDQGTLAFLHGCGNVCVDRCTGGLKQRTGVEVLAATEVYS